MAGIDPQVGKGFVVLQQHIVAWVKPLDEASLDQERLGFVFGDHRLDMRDLRHHAHDAVIKIVDIRVARYPVTDVFALPT